MQKQRALRDELVAVFAFHLVFASRGGFFLRLARLGLRCLHNTKAILDRGSSGFVLRAWWCECVYRHVQSLGFG